jgi:transposase InsO family protein
VGWHLDPHIYNKLVFNTINWIATLHQPVPSLIIHADRSSQHTSLACRARIEKAQTLASYGRLGNPYNNAQAEAGWSTLKTELLPNGGAFVSLEETRLEVAYYLDTYFALDRHHSALGYRSPPHFERHC